MTSDCLGNVSRETNEKLEEFALLVQKWTAKINLISKPSIPTIWQRHIQDSVQLYSLAPNVSHWLDIGSGGGFPAIVLALLSQQDGRDTKFTMIESDQRKCVFLRTALRELRVSGAVINNRIEKVDPLSANIVSARALADLTTLIGFADRHMVQDGLALFPKGESWRDEELAARQSWTFQCEAVTSQTSQEAAILKIKEIAHV